MKASVRAGAAIKGFDPGYSGTIRDPSRYPRNSCTFLNVFTKSCNIVASVAHQRFRRALVRAKSSVENRSSRSRALKRRHQHGHVLIPIHPPASFGRFQHASSDPAEHHRTPAPAFHVPLHVGVSGSGGSRRVGRRQRSAEPLREPQPDHGECLVEGVVRLRACPAHYAQFQRRDRVECPVHSS